MLETATTSYTADNTNSTEIPAAVQALQDFWDNHVAAFHRYQQERQANVSKLRAALDSADDCMLLGGDIEHDNEKIRDRVLKAVFIYAERHFAPAGTRMEISEHDYLRDNDGRRLYSGKHPDYDQPLDVIGLWQAIAADYGGQSGYDEACRQHARTIIQGFTIRENEEIKMVTGRVRLDHHAYVDDILGNNRLEVRAKMRLEETISSLEMFARLYSHDDLMLALGDLRLYLNGPCTITSREKVVKTESLVVITFKQRFEFRFSQAVANDLQQFIGEYGTDFLYPERW